MLVMIKFSSRIRYLYAVQVNHTFISRTDSVIIPLGIQASVGTGYTIALDDASNLESIDMYMKDYETGALQPYLNINTG